MEEFLIFLLVGFMAQVVDGALGMAYGLVSTTLLLSVGLPPALASAATHTAECITTGFSALAHHQFGNINTYLFRRLLIPGMVGSILGVIVLMQLEPIFIKPFIAIYLLVLGVIIITKVFRQFPPRAVTRHLTPLGFFGGLMDAIGGGGWGSIVTSTLLVQGHDIRTTIGSVNACEFFVAITASFAFFLGGVEIGWKVVLALALGGALAAPVGAWVCKYIPVKVLFFAVGCLIILLSSRMLWMSWVASR